MSEREAAKRAAREAFERAEDLLSAGSRRRAAWIADAVTRLSKRVAGGEDDPLRERLMFSTGLSAPMVQWGLSSTAATFTEAALSQLARSGGPGAPPSLVAVVLSGNVFTAPLRALALPLLIGAPVVCKASSRDDVLPHALAHSLAQADGELADALQVVTFGRDDDEALSAMLEHASHVSVYGDDASVDAVAGKVRGDARVLRHGQGLGAIYLPWQCLRDARAAQAVARRVAIDLCAYDQRGCLSPHFVLVQSGGALDAAGFATLLHEQAMPELEAMMPRGPLDETAQAQQMQWRGVAAARGTLMEGPAHAVSFEGKQPLRLSPGHRNVGVYDCSSAPMCAELLHPFEAHLKVIAVGDDEAARTQLLTEYEGGGPYLCAVGHMQTPPVDAPQDGKPALWGLR